MRQRRSRCPSRLCAPLVTWLGLAVSLSASLAQDVQKLAQVNTAQMMPGPRVGPPVLRPVRPFTGTESPLLREHPAPRQRPFTGTEPPLLQESPASRQRPFTGTESPLLREHPAPRQRPFTGTEPPLLQEGPAGTEPPLLQEGPAGMSARRRVQVRVCSDRRTRAPQKLRDRSQRVPVRVQRKRWNGLRSRQLRSPLWRAWAPPPFGMLGSECWS